MKNLEPLGKIILNIVVTFVQGAGAVWVATGFATDRLTIGAVAGAGFSAVWNLVLKPAAKNYGLISE